MSSQVINENYISLPEVLISQFVISESLFIVILFPTTEIAS